MMYQLILGKKVESFLVKAQERDYQLFEQFIGALDRISSNPYSAKALIGNLKGYYSYRVRDYRIIFEIDKRKSIIYIEKIEHRREVYR